MDFRTTFEIEPSSWKINYSTPVMFVGSCFASEIGTLMGSGKMDVNINPTGTVFNPLSVINTLELVIQNKKVHRKDLYNHNGAYLSFLHYTSFNSEDPDAVVRRINKSTSDAHNFLRKARFLFITFGTARIYRLRDSGIVVSNCHRIPSSMFTTELLTPELIISEWSRMLEKLRAFNPNLSVIFTISPVRHWKDGAHGNQVSKSVLFLAVEKLLEHADTGYFPAYELLMDDLRDYRFYETDMLHPSDDAVKYIWNAFSDCYFEKETFLLWKKAYGVTAALNHRFVSGSYQAIKDFAGVMLKKIEAITMNARGLDFSKEQAYFRSLIKKG